MTSADRNDFVPAPQEKQEWVTPKISLMETGEAEGNKRENAKEYSSGDFGHS
jgi:hypothetical protein